MKNHKNAFTLTELLIAIGIIGAIAAISIPSLITKIQNQMFLTNFKGTVEAVKMLADKQIMTSPTRGLVDTDFESPSKLLTTSNFKVIKVCRSSDTSCWENKQYKTLNNLSYASVTSPANRSAKLKNGASIAYSWTVMDEESDSFGIFYIDLNGDDLPNIVGRDYFAFYISSKGKIYSDLEGQSLDEMITACKGGSPTACFGSIMANGWKMPY